MDPPQHLQPHKRITAKMPWSALYLSASLLPRNVLLLPGNPRGQGPWEGLSTHRRSASWCGVCPLSSQSSLKLTFILFSPQAGIGSFKGLIDDLVASLNREKEGLKLAKDHLENEMKQFALEKERVNQVLSDNEQAS